MKIRSIICGVKKKLDFVKKIRYAFIKEKMIDFRFVKGKSDLFFKG